MNVNVDESVIDGFTSPNSPKTKKSWIALLGSNFVIGFCRYFLTSRPDVTCSAHSGVKAEPRQNNELQ
jgi:hypothetical protein